MPEYFETFVFSCNASIDAQLILGVENAFPMTPTGEIEIIPPHPPSRSFMCARALCSASWGGVLVVGSDIISMALFAKQTFMMDSPCPVVLTPPLLLSQ